MTPQPRSSRISAVVAKDPPIGRLLRRFRARETDHITNPWPLSAAQARFADANECRHYLSAVADDGCVYMYRENNGWTQRWLVAPDGTELERERLHYA
jgi:hypothetical protein